MTIAKMTIAHFLQTFVEKFADNFVTHYLKKTTFSEFNRFF